MVLCDVVELAEMQVDDEDPFDLGEHFWIGFECLNETEEEVHSGDLDFLWG